MKIRDVLKEGFWSGFASKIQPEVFQKKERFPTRGTGIPTEKDVAKRAQQLYGIEPDEPTPTEKPVPNAPPVDQTAQTMPAEPKVEVPAEQPSAEQPSSEPEYEEPVNLADEPLARDERIAVETPAGTMYKYPNGRWYQIPSTGIPAPVPSNQYAILDDYANMEGHVEKIPPTKRKKR